MHKVCCRAYEYEALIDEFGAICQDSKTLVLQLLSHSPLRDSELKSLFDTPIKDRVHFPDNCRQVVCQLRVPIIEKSYRNAQQ